MIEPTNHGEFCEIIEFYGDILNCSHGYDSCGIYNIGCNRIIFMGLFYYNPIKILKGIMDIFLDNSY